MFATITKTTKPHMLLFQLSSNLYLNAAYLLSRILIVAMREEDVSDSCLSCCLVAMLVGLSLVATLECVPIWLSVMHTSRMLRAIFHFLDSLFISCSQQSVFRIESQVGVSSFQTACRATVLPNGGC
jgi:hypothetical protein